MALKGHKRVCKMVWEIYDIISSNLRLFCNEDLLDECIIADLTSLEDEIVDFVEDPSRSFTG